MKTFVYFALFASLAVLLVAQQPAKAKRVWTNEDFPSVSSTPKPDPVPSQPMAPASSARAPKTVEETEARLELRVKWLSDLQAALGTAKDELMHASSRQQRHAILIKIRVIEQDIEDVGAEIHDLESKLGTVKADSKTEPKSTPLAGALLSAVEIDGVRR